MAFLPNSLKKKELKEQVLEKVRVLRNIMSSMSLESYIVELEALLRLRAARIEDLEKAIEWLGYSVDEVIKEAQEDD